MTVGVIFVLLVLIAAYWIKTQIMPERKKVSLLRPGLADGLLTVINDRRHTEGLTLLELDGELMAVAENKASHQLLTGRDEEGWDYPTSFAGMFGRSLLIEVLISGPATMMGERLARQRELFDGEWVTCGIGVAGGQSTHGQSSEQIIVAMVLCREAWEVARETERGGLLRRLALGD